MSLTPPLPVPDDESDLTPEEEDEIMQRAEAAEEAEKRGDLSPWEKLFPGPPVVLDEEEELARRLDEIPELDRQRRLRPVGDFLAEMRAEIRQRRAG